MNYKGSTYMTEERIKLAGEEKKDRLYEPKQNQKAIKVLTVAAYVLCVSLAAIMLSFYYIFIWNPTTKPTLIQARTANCDKIVIPENLANRLANASEITLETFLKNYSMHFKLDVEKPKLIQIQEIKTYPRMFERIEQSTLKYNNEIKKITKQPILDQSLINNNDNNKEEFKKLSTRYKKNNKILNTEDDEDDERDDVEPGDYYASSGHREIYEQFNKSSAISEQAIEQN